MDDSASMLWFHNTEMMEWIYNIPMLPPARSVIDIC